MGRPPRNHSVDYLRGFAALMVCVCHFRLALPDFTREFAKIFGELGVQVFFVVSGYIIPYSLSRSEYRLADFERFWLKRFLRLQPTFLIALALTCVASLAAAAMTGGVSEFTPMNFLRFAFYLGKPAENPVIWTLIVELKYYLFIACLFPLFFSASWVQRSSALLLSAALAVAATSYIEWFRHLPYFLIGFCVCNFVLRPARRTEFVALGLVSVLAMTVHSTWSQVTAGALTGLYILFVNSPPNRVATFFGNISYSLYLVHFVIGVKLLNLALPRLPEVPRILLGAATLGVCTAVAYILYRLVEKPSSQWSQSVRFAAQKSERPKTDAERIEPSANLESAAI